MQYTCLSFFVELLYPNGQRICIQEYIFLCGTVWTWRLQGENAMSSIKMWT